jgi:hypothetical protein
MEYLKKSSPNVTVVTQDIKETVSSIISDLEREGISQEHAGRPLRHGDGRPGRHGGSRGIGKVTD